MFTEYNDSVTYLLDCLYKEPEYPYEGSDLELQDRIEEHEQCRCVLL